MMLRLLASSLEDALGGRLVVERSGGRFRRSEEVRSMQVTMGNDVLSAEVSGSSVRCSVSHSSGGIRIRSEELPMDAWLGRLLQGLKTEAAHSDQARQALENLMIGGTP